MISFSAAAKTIRAFFNRNTPEPDFAFCAGALVNANGVVGAKVNAAGNLVFIGEQINSVADALTAGSGGTPFNTQATGTPLTAQVNRFTTVGGAGYAATLPVAAAGLEIAVINATATSMNVFPAGTDAINALSASAAYAVPAFTTVTFYSTVAAQWNTNGVSTLTGSGASVRQNSPTINTPAIIQPQVTISGDGAIAIASGTVFLTKGSAAAITLAAPTSGAPGTGQDGTRITVIAGSSFAHVITATSLVEDGTTGVPHTTITFAAFKGASVILEAQTGLWYVVSNNHATVS